MRFDMSVAKTVFICARWCRRSAQYPCVMVAVMPLHDSAHRGTHALREYARTQLGGDLRGDRVHTRRGNENLG